MFQFFKSTLSNQQCRFRKSLNTRQSLLVLLEKSKRSVDSGKTFGPIYVYKQHLKENLLLLFAWCCPFCWISLLDFGRHYTRRNLGLSDSFCSFPPSFLSSKLAI